MRFVFHHFKARHPAALSAAHVAIAEGSARQRADRTGTCGMAATAPAALQDFGPLVFGNHALHLEQEIILRRAANRAVQKDDFRAGATKLVDQKDLMGVPTRQPIRSVDINAFDLAARNCVPQPLQRRTRQHRTAVAFIHIAVIRFERHAIGGDALAQRRDLAGDRVVARLALTRHPRVERALRFVHRSPPVTAFAIFTLDGGASLRFGRRHVRRTAGMRRA